VSEIGNHEHSAVVLAGGCARVPNKYNVSHHGLRNSDKRGIAVRLGHAVRDNKEL
jgi:hypothetical protein